MSTTESLGIIVQPLVQPIIDCVVCAPAKEFDELLGELYDTLEIHSKIELSSTVE